MTMSSQYGVLLSILEKLNTDKEKYCKTFSVIDFK